MVAFSKIKAASIVRVKKPANSKPTSSSKAESITVRTEEVSSLKAESTAVQPKVDSNLKGESTAVRPDAKTDESSVPSTNATIVPLDSEAKKTDSSKTNEASTSLSLLGNYDSSSNSEDSD